MPEWSDLVATFGPIGALVFWMIWQGKMNMPKKPDDPVRELSDKLSSINDRLIRVETLLEGKK